MSLNSTIWCLSDKIRPSALRFYTILPPKPRKPVGEQQPIPPIHHESTFHRQGPFAQECRLKLATPPAPCQASHRSHKKPHPLGSAEVDRLADIDGPVGDRQLQIPLSSCTRRLVVGTGWSPKRQALSASTARRIEGSSEAFAAKSHSG